MKFKTIRNDSGNLVCAEHGFRVYELEKFDAAENYFFSRELETISRKMHAVEFAQGLTRKLLPINNEMPPEDESFTWRLWDQFGKAKRMADAADDVNQVGVKGTENNQIVQVYALGFSYTEDEVRKAAKLQRPLEQDRAKAVREGIERQLNDVATDGDSDGGLTGFLGLTGTNTGTPKTKGAGGTAWLDVNGLLVATADEVISDVNLAIRKPFADSAEIEKVRRVVIPTAQMAAISQTPRSAQSDTTILQFLKTNNPDVEFMSWERLKYVVGGSTPNLTADRLIAYNPDPSKLELILPIEFEQQAPQLKNYRYRVNCRMKSGGVIAYRPKSILFMDAI